jgi:Uma2 family endonuclease
MTDMMIGTKSTFAEYAEMEESNQIIELIDGDIRMAPPPSDSHQETSGDTYFTLRSLVKTGTFRYAPTGVHLDDENIFEPDIFWVSPNNTKCALEPGRRYWLGAPDLIVEILSPSTSYHDRRQKYVAYELHGVREYWLMDTDAQTVEVYILMDGKFVRLNVFKVGESFDSQVFGITIPVSLLFGVG